MLTACSNDDNLAEAPAKKTVPFTVTVSASDAAKTRIDVGTDRSTLYFSEGDKLYVKNTSTGVVDELTNLEILEGNKSAKFTGNLTVPEGLDDIPAETMLEAYLVSKDSKMTIDGFSVTTDNDGNWKYNAGSTPSICTSIQDAVNKYSLLKGESTYEDSYFELSQTTAFIDFELTLTGNNAPAVGDYPTIVVYNNNYPYPNSKVISNWANYGDDQQYKYIAVQGNNENKSVLKFALALPAINLEKGSYVSVIGTKTGGVTYVNKTQSVDPKVYEVKKEISQWW